MLNKTRAFIYLLGVKIKYFFKVKILRLHKYKLIAADYLENPLLKFPRNLPCFCGSSLKAKRCCLPKQAKVIPADQAIKLKQYIDYVDSVSN